MDHSNEYIGGTDSLDIKGLGTGEAFLTGRAERRSLVFLISRLQAGECLSLPVGIWLQVVSST
jgi:hypothetical protein